MTKAEFEKLAGCKVSGEDYETIEYVYTWYPTVSETEGKKQVATIYSMLGMAPFRDMLTRARLAEDAETRLRTAKRRVQEIEQEIRDLREEA